LLRERGEHVNYGTAANRKLFHFFQAAIDDMSKN